MAKPQSPVPELYSHGPPSSANSLVQTIFTFVCAKLQRLYGVAPQQSSGRESEGPVSLSFVCSWAEGGHAFLRVPAPPLPGDSFVSLPLSFLGPLPWKLLPSCGHTRFTPPGGWLIVSIFQFFSGCSGGEQSPDWPSSWFMETRTENSLLVSLTVSRFPAPPVGHSTSSGTPVHSVTPRILKPHWPTENSALFIPWPPSREGCLSLEPISKGSDFVLQGYIAFW